jgi:hypothetical protein
MNDIADDHNHIEELVVGHFDGTLTEKQEKELAEKLAASASAKQLFLSYMRMEGRLHSLGRDGFLREPILETQDVDARPADSTHGVRNHPAPGRSRRSHVWTASTSLAVCAAVMLTWTLWSSSVSASSVLERAQQAAAEMVDRTYQLVMSHPDAEGEPTTRELTITVRGGGRFVIQPAHDAYVMGSDGTEYWMARRNGPVFITGDLRLLAPELQRQIPNRRLLDGVLASPDEPLLLDMSGLLLLIERRYDIQLVDSPNPGEHHVRATRRSGIRGGASVINFHADAESGVVLKAELSFGGSRQRTWKLIEAPSLSDEWYHHSRHAPGRRIQSLDAVP